MNEINGAVPAHLLHDSATQGPQHKKEMGKDDFLNLLMTQLKHQDPLKPMDHHEFATQLAQFGSLEKLSNIQSGVEGMRNDRGSDTKLAALNFIGKQVSAQSNEVDLIAGKIVKVKPQLTDGLSPTKAMVYNSAGQMLRELSLNAKSNREVIEWDGKDNQGIEQPSGTYAFRIFGSDSKGQTREITAGVDGKVVGVEMEGTAPVLMVETQGTTSRITLDKINKISEAKDSEKSNHASSASTTVKSVPIETPAQVRVAEPEDLVASSEDEGASSWDDPRFGIMGRLR